MIINKKKLILPVLLFVIVISVFAICKIRGHSYDLELFRSDDGWGYDILRNEVVYIHQPYIPSIPGQKAFTDKKSARKTGRLVIRKLRDHKVPSVTKEELKSII
jgi:hypothetical protein